MTDNTPSTPSWMTDNRSRRNRRGYGRRSGANGAAYSGTTKIGRGRDSALEGRFGSFSNIGSAALSPGDHDDGEGSVIGGDDVLDRSANARLEGRRRPPRSMLTSRSVDVLDHSAHARLESKSIRAAVNNDSEGLDLIEEFEHMSKPKKKRPNLPRPPKKAAATRSRGRGGGVGGVTGGKKKSSSTSQFGVRKVESNSFVFESDALENGNDSPNNSSNIASVVAGGGGDAKRSKFAYRRSNSSSTVSSSPFEENVHPNDTTVADTNNLSAGVVTRRSSRLVKKNMASRASLAASQSPNDNATFVTTRSRAKANSKKRSATSADATIGGSSGSSPPAQPPQRSPPNLRSASASSLCTPSEREPPQRSPPNLRSASVTSSSSGSFSSSNSTMRNSAIGSGGSESFSSLARQCSDKSWASGKASSSSKGAVGKKGYPQHKRSVSVASSLSKNGNNSTVSTAALKTPSSSAALKTPSSNNTVHNRSISCGGDHLSLGSQSFMSPDPGGTHLSTPSVGSSSSRKRSCMDFTSLSHEDFEDLGGSERVSRSRTGPTPPPFVMDGAISEIPPIPSLKRTFSEPKVGPAATPRSIFSPPQKLSFGNTLVSKMCFVGSDDDIVDEKKEDVRDPFSSNDDSMMSTESEEEDVSASSNFSDEDDECADEEEETPREMTDTEVFETKSSYEDLRFLIKSLQRWASQHSQSKGHYQASMGLNNGCLIAVPPSWTFEHRANFAKWVVTAFGFRVGSVGGAGCGTFLRCGDADGREALVRLRRIWNDYKAGRLILSAGSGEAKDAAIGKKKSIEKPKAKFPIKLSSTQRLSSLSKKGPRSLAMSSFCDEFVGDLLADRMKGVTLDKTPNETKPARSSTPDSNCSVPHFIRSMTRQPFANKIKSTALPCFHNNSPKVGSNKSSGGGARLPRLSSESAIGGSDLLDQIHGGCVNSPIPSVTRQPFANKIKNMTLPCFRNNSPKVGNNGGKSGRGTRPPRLSSESAIHGSDLLNQLHGDCGNSPSPLPSRFPGRLRDRAGRALQPVVARRPSLEKISFRTSFERPMNGQQLPFESPHPRTSLALETPSSRSQFGLETPMPKQAENWGSRPVLGQDWGESACCCDVTIAACSQIFAKSWFTSEFYGNEDLSAQHRMVLDGEDESSLFAFYEADANLSDDNDDDNSELASINRESMDEFPTEFMSKKIGFTRCDSLGASAFNLLNLEDKVKYFDCELSPILDRRRTLKLRKYARMSLCAAAASDFLQQPKFKRCNSLKGTSIHSIVDSTAFSCVLSFLNEGELIHAASLVCTTWADAAAEALGTLMRVSVGCDPSLNDKIAEDDCSSDGADENDFVDMQTNVSPRHSSVAKSMERDWPYLMARFPWAKFLSDGSFKRVYKVWNNHCGAYEAISVMDVDAIADLGNLNLVGTELAVSVLLSSVARRNICPNFVVTRGVFTCQHEPPAPLWGCKDNSAPCGATYDGRHTQTSGAPKPDQCGNYQYIRMELCQHGDIEEFIKKQPEKMLAPGDCRNILFQMAFALHVAGDRFGLKHYDVKLLNFFLQSARDPTITDKEHPHVVLRYGVGSHIFRLRMHATSAHIAKLADYGTSVTRTDTDGQPVSIGQFTTLENTPPDFLILGNAAEQGYGHDCFGLGLCMLHLFTGHGPYEEILDEVVCPANLKGKLRKIWKQKSHNVIRSVIFDNDENGTEIEDETLYDTLYRFLVLFGIPEKQFGMKKHGKVWRALNSTLLPPSGPRSRKCPDIDVFNRDRKKFSLADGTDKRIAAARQRLLEMDGAMELLLLLVSFDPKTRATPLDVINSEFMGKLIEDDNAFYCEEDIVKSYTAYLTN